MPTSRSTPCPTLQPTLTHALHPIPRPHPRPAPAAVRPSRRALLGLSLATLAALAAALGAGCASKSEVRHDRDAVVDFRSYRTFAFQEVRGTAGGALGTGYSTLHEARLQQAARAALERQGLTQVAQDPDLRVHVAMRLAERQELHASPTARGPGLGARGWNAARIDTVYRRHGTLVVDLVDTRRNALVWRGVAEGAVDAADLQAPGPAIERAMAEVLAGFKR
jgi:hypothetical protein